jgi:hypothetical protein
LIFISGTMKSNFYSFRILKKYSIPLLICLLIVFSINSAFKGNKVKSPETPSVAYIIQLSSDNATLASDYDDISRKNIYGICWRGEYEDNLKFAKQMGYSHVMYQDGMENSPLSSGLYFLLQKPENMICPHLNVSAVISLNRTYPIEQQKIYRENFALKSLTAPFPDNLATGWYTFDRNKKPVTFAVVQDWQQKRMVDLGVELAVSAARKAERPEKNFLFGGLAWDEAELTGDFSNDSAAINRGANVAVTLAHWNGGDFSPASSGTTHEYATHSDGKAAFYKELKKSFRELYPGRKLIYLWEPYKINGDLLEQIYQRPDMEELLSDVMLVAEGEGKQLTQFADDETLFASGVIKRDWVGSTQPNEHRFDQVKEIVGKAGIHGSWFGWFGRFNQPGEGRIDHIYDVPHWHQLARVIPSWDNLCGVPLEQRKWDGNEYRSSNSCMNEKILYSRQHKTNKLFVVFLDPSGSIPLKPGDKVISVKRVDNFFCETSDALSEVVISKDKITLAKP